MLHPIQIFVNFGDRIFNGIKIAANSIASTFHVRLSVAAVTIAFITTGDTAISSTSRRPELLRLMVGRDHA